jgi:hypothetical protein
MFVLVDTPNNETVLLKRQSLQVLQVENLLDFRYMGKPIPVDYPNLLKSSLQLLSKLPRLGLKDKYFLTADLECNYTFD